MKPNFICLLKSKLCKFFRLKTINFIPSLVILFLFKSNNLIVFNLAINFAPLSFMYFSGSVKN